MIRKHVRALTSSLAVVSLDGVGSAAIISPLPVTSGVTSRELGIGIWNHQKPKVSCQGHALPTDVGPVHAGVQ
jgi:hypothetical protein